MTEHFQVLAMAETAGGDTSVADLTSPPALVRSDNIIGRCINNGLYEVLPERRDGGTAKGLQNLNVTMSGGVDAMVDHQQKQLQHQVEEAKKKAEEKEKKKKLVAKLPSDLILKRMLRLFGLRSEDELPMESALRKWTECENKSIESFRAVLQETVREKARQMGKLQMMPVLFHWPWPTAL